MLNLNVKPEGFLGQKDSLIPENWDEMYAALREGRLLQGKVTGTEKQEDGEEVLIVNHGLHRCVIKDQDIGPRPKKLEALVGSDVAFKVKAVDRGKNRVYLDRASALEEMASETWDGLTAIEETLKPTMDEIRQINKELDEAREAGNDEKAAELRVRRDNAFQRVREEGPTVTCTVRWVVDSAAYVDIGGIIAQLPNPEIRHGYVENARDHIEPGRSFDVKIIWVDRKNGTVKVSLKALMPDPWESIRDRYKEEGLYFGRIVNFDRRARAVVELEPGVIVISDLPSFTKPSVGNEVTVRIKTIGNRTMYGPITKVF